MEDSPKNETEQDLSQILGFSKIILFSFYKFCSTYRYLLKIPFVSLENQFQVRVLGVAVDHVCMRGMSQCVCVVGKEAASQGHFQISLVGLSCGQRGILSYTEIVFLDMSAYKGHLSPL